MKEIGTQQISNKTSPWRVLDLNSREAITEGYNHYYYYYCICCIEAKNPSIVELHSPWTHLTIPWKETHKLIEEIFGCWGERWGEGIVKGVWDRHVRTAIFKIDNQHKSILWHSKICSVLCGSLNGRGPWGRMDTCICMAESLPCSPETITTLLINYTPI